jgi:glycosyltransferase involved in cell wall biosynthesis
MISLEESVSGGEARNIGVAAAAGQWIALLDDDEEWLSEKVSAQLRLAAQESDEGVVVVSNFIALKGCQDLDWFLRIMAHPGVKLCVTQEPLTVYYVPESRASVSREFSWQFRMGWGCSQKHLMTARAYSRFVVSVCATKAALEPFSLRAFLVLLRECLFAGRPNVRTVMHLLALFLLPDKVHQAVRDLLAVPLGRPVTASNSSIS